MKLKGVWLFVILCFGGIWFFSIASAQEDFVNDTFDSCPTIDFELLGQHEVKSNQLYEYSLTAQDYSEFASWLNVIHTIRKWPDQLEAIDQNSFSYDFALTGTYIIESDVVLQNECGSEVLDLSTAQGEEWNFQLLFKEILIDSTNSSEILLANLSQFASYFRYADSLVIDTSSQWLVFETLWKIFELNEVETSGIDVYVVADTAQSYFRRLLARYITASWLERVYVTQEQYFWSLFTSLLLRENPQQYDFIKSYSVSLEESNKRTFMSYMTDYLLINWFPLWILTLVLLLPFVWLLISIARQVVWLSVFGVFTPLLFAISMYVIWVSPSLMLLLSAALAVILTYLISMKIYLLYSPKISLMMILYSIVTLLVWWWHQSLDLWWVNIDAYANSFAIFPFVVILLVAKYVFSENFLQFRKWRRIDLIEFFVISLWVFYILNSTYLQNIFLWNPELILLVLLLNILVGRFTWLQLAEYFRFFPLIKNYFEEE